jgi:hypothetical protein
MRQYLLGLFNLAPLKISSLLFFGPIDPGEDHLCGSIQAKSVEAYSAAVSFSATAGNVNHFTTKDPNHPTPKEQVKLVALDPAEADLDIASSPFSTSTKRNSRHPG